MLFQVKRRAVRIEHGTIEADSHQQAADLLRTGMWGDSVQPRGETYREHSAYEVNGVPVTHIGAKFDNVEID